MNTTTCYRLIVIPFALLSAALLAQEPRRDAVKTSSELASATPRDRRAKALADAARGDWKSAEPALALLAQAEPVDVDVCVQLSRFRMRSGNTKEGVALIARAAAAAPDRAEIQLELGNALARRIGEVNFIQQALIASEMRAAYEKTVALDPRSIGGWIGLTQYFANAPTIAGGSLEKAGECAKRVKELDPYQGALQLAVVALKSGKFDRVVEEFERAGELKTVEPWPYVHLGRAYLKRNQFSEATRAFEVALQRDPNCEPAKAGLRDSETASTKEKP